MNFHELLDSNGNWCDLPTIRLAALLHYPNDERSRLQLSQYLLSELEYAEKVGPEKYSSSDFGKAIENHVLKQTGQIALAGLMTLAFWRQALDQGDRMSQYAVAKKIEEVISNERGSDGKAVFIEGLVRGEYTVSGFRTSTSRGDIEKAFRKHKRLAHFHAARFLWTAANPATHWPIEMRKSPDRYVKTVAEIEKVVREHFSEYFGDLEPVASILPERFDGVSPYPFFGDAALALKKVGFD